MLTQNKSEDEAVLAIRDHVNRGYGEILIQVQPKPGDPSKCKVRVRRGPAEIFEVDRHGA